MRAKMIPPDPNPAATTLEYFEELRRLHKLKLKVSWSCMAYDHDNTVAILRLENISGRKGQGRLAMTEICTLADHRQVPMRLWNNVAKLDAYFEAFGFKADVKRYSNETRWFRRIPITLESSKCPS